MSTAGQLSTSTTQSPRLEHRPDIDGLRAVAVAAVIGFHAFPSRIEGGFVGVDVFFVISGFLISSIILRDLESGAFTFRGFYGRRIRRIFPALLIVLAASYAIGWIVLSSDEYKRLGKHMAGGAAFLSNIILWGEAGYFDSAAHTKPLLHLWSLGIEEQFYIVWPLLLWLFRRRRPTTLAVTGLIALASFAINASEVRTHAEAAFYSPQSRFWELLIGSILAQLTMRERAAATLGTGTTQSIAGAVMIVGGILLIRKEYPFPGWWAMAPVCGAALMIAAGPAAWPNRRVLSNRTLVWFGAISYPLYLWHWPLLSFVRTARLGAPTPWLLVVAVVFLSVALAWLTHELIESRLRFGKHQGAKAAWLGVAMSAACCAGYDCWEHDGFDGAWGRPGGPVALSRGVAPEAARRGVNHPIVLDQGDVLRGRYRAHFDNSPPAFKYLQKIGEAYRFECDFYQKETWGTTGQTTLPRREIPESCFKRDTVHRDAVFIWGDSHAQHLHPGLRKRLPASWQVLQVASQACGPRIVDGPSATDYCDQSNWFALKAIREARPRVVILADHDSKVFEKFGGISEVLRSLGVSRIIVAGPVPRWNTDLPRIIATELWPDTPRRTKVGLDLSTFSRNADLEKDFPHSAVNVFANVLGVFCDASAACLTYLGDDKLVGTTSWDTSHLTLAASDHLARVLLVGLITNTTE
jgi:peptidoglycan/LPS O-acetylase OafA/YrhL